MYIQRSCGTSGRFLWLQSLLDNINEDKTSESDDYYSVTFSSALILVVISTYRMFEKLLSR
ncbi:hypothetical protein M514_22850 [Trichuris suis]|uniref:Uncharacterized protein n=1 Tax=Trichuris suis TaxID=68888 RepID=A0A085N6A5_9BILA|nr:hypothetical protein M514_22850 [Trichuris suis]